MERSLLSLDTQGKFLLASVVNTDDRISTLSDDILLKIISKLSTEESVRTSTLSRRWRHVWKEISSLFLDMRKLFKLESFLSYVPLDVARSMTKVINDHRGHLERCAIYHYAFQCKEGLVEAWVQSLIHEKQAKDLTIINFSPYFLPKIKFSYTLDLSPNSFSHPNLTSLHLGHYNLKSPDGFNNCGNLKNLKLIGIFADIGVFNEVLLSCSSLQVLVLDINCHKRSGPLKIENRNLKYLFLSCYKIDSVEVASPNLDVLTVEYLACGIEKLVVANPRLQFNRNYWATGELFSHTSFNVSYSNQETKNIAHEFMISKSSREYIKRYASMSVSVDLKNIREFYMLKEVLGSWPQEMTELEIVFKNNNAPMEEDESSIGITQEMFWEETKPFPNDYFHADTVWLFNFSGSKEEFALASRFITQGTVVKTMMIKPLSNPVSNKLKKIVETVAILKELPKGHEELNIIMF